MPTTVFSIESWGAAMGIKIISSQELNQNVSKALVPVIARLDRAIQAVMERKGDDGIWIPGQPGV